ncbi:MAG: GC-type dockerin domain-anchored protein [Phycisphaerales bacterium]
MLTMRAQSAGLPVGLMASLLIAAGAASAQPVYDNGVGGPAGLVSSLVADSSVPQTVADGVRFAADQPVTAIEWTGAYAGGDGVPPAADNFVILVRADAAGSPGSVIASFPVGAAVARTAVPPGTSVLTNIYTYRASIGFTFLAGVDYWIEIENDNGNRDDDRWAWGTGSTGTGGSAWFSANLGATWFDSTFPGTDFRLFNETEDCPADTNTNGVLDPGDFTAWVAAYNQQGPECDQNGDGRCDPADFTAWVANYNAGCP